MRLDEGMRLEALALALILRAACFDNNFAITVKLK